MALVYAQHNALVPFKRSLIYIRHNKIGEPILLNVASQAELIRLLEVRHRIEYISVGKISF